MECIRLFVVDDKPSNFESVMNTNLFEKIGFETIGKSTVDELSLSELEAKVPDVIILHMETENMSGIDFIERAKKINPELIFIIIGQYHSFEFLKKAYDIGVYLFLTLPIKEEQLQSVMYSVRQKYIESKNVFQKKKRWGNFFENHKNSYISVVIERYVRGRISQEEFLEVVEVLDSTNHLECWYACWIINLDIACLIQDEVEYAAKQLQVYTYLMKQISSKNELWYFYGTKGELIMFAAFENEEDSYYILKELEAGITDLFQVEIVSVISNSKKGIVKLKELYEETLGIFKLTRESNAGELIVKEEAVRQSEDRVLCKNTEIYIMKAIRENDLVQFKDAYIKYIYSLPRQDVDSIYACIHRLALDIEYLLYDSYGWTKEIKKKFCFFYQNIHIVHETKAVDLLYQIVRNVIEVRLEEPKKPQKPAKQTVSDYMEQAIQYIDEHIGEESLSIIEVAGAIYLNPVYFGRVFKNSEGISFKQYVLNRRMELAKQLICDKKDNVTSIGQQVGIGNSSYFAQLFKQYTGVLPSEYREII